MPSRRSAIPFPKTLWDLLPIPRGRKPGPAPDKPARQREQPPAAPSKARTGGARARYDELTREMLDRYGVRVRKWRTSMSGVAWRVTYRDGSVSRLIESPKPRGPMSCAIFLHEIGHHAIGLGAVKPRCLEELEAWRFAIRTMRDRGFNVTDRVLERMDLSLRYAVAKARRRGLKALPAELTPYDRPLPVRAPARPQRRG